MQLESKFTNFKLLTTKYTGFTDMWHISMPPSSPRLYAYVQPLA